MSKTRLLRFSSLCKTGSSSLFHRLDRQQKEETHKQKNSQGLNHERCTNNTVKYFYSLNI